MDFLTGLKELARMRTDHRRYCLTCHEDSVGAALSNMSDKEISRLVEKVERWSAEYPVKTMEDAFFEAFPSPKRFTSGCLATCPDELVPAWGALCGPVREKDPEKCKKCWRRPVP